MAHAAQPPLAVPPGSADLAKRGRALVGDRLFWLLTLGAGLLVLAILALIVYSTLRAAWPALLVEGLDFFTSPQWVTPTESGGRAESYGALGFILGTVMVSAIALLIAVPVSIGIALFLTEMARGRLRTVAVTVLDLLAAVPSVVFGLWGIFVLAGWMKPFFGLLHDVLGPIPLLGSLFGEPAARGSIALAGLIVALMIIPIITSITREVFATVPTADKQAALALGATRWEMIKGTVFPHSFGGLVGAVMIGLGRALGETIAISLTIGSIARISPNILGTGQALPSVIVQEWPESQAGSIFQSALFACGVLLFVVTVLVNYLARSVVRRAQQRMRGA